MHPSALRLHPIRLSIVVLTAALLTAGCVDPVPPGETPAMKPPPGYGAPDLGSSEYAVPAGARFVAPTGDDAAAGTRSEPWRTLGHAVAEASSGDTIVLRAGTYHEQVEVPPTKVLTIQAAAGEVVLMSGSRPVSGWVAEGSAWRRDGWTAEFPSAVASAALVDPAFPMAAHPDMVFVDGRPLIQVGSRAAVTSGTFFVDDAADRLYIGTNPEGRQVEGSVLSEGLNVRSPGSRVRGIGFEHYATHITRNGAVKGVDGTVWEDNLFRQNAAAGLSVRGLDVVIRNNTATDNGQVGFQAHVTSRLRFEGNSADRNNIERFSPAAAAGGVKFTESTDVEFRRNRSEDNRGHGFWFDESSHRAVVVGNLARRNRQGAGIMFEMSDDAIIASNISAENTGGIQANEAGAVDIWNNTLVDNEYAIAVYDGVRPPVPRGFVVRNNVLSTRRGSSRPLVIVEDVNRRRSWSAMGWSSDHNAMYRHSTSAVPWFQALANYPVSKLSLRNLSAVREATPLEPNSQSVDDAARDPFVTDPAGDYRLPATSPIRGRGAALPSRVAVAVGMREGTVVDAGVLPYLVP
jgi:Right handed beta helix region/Protein of unknown function (DUF1565)